jgi:hypothetical protein
VKRSSLFIICLSLFSCQIFGKVRILTFHCNQANFIELQYRCLEKFLLDDYELIVFNDASTWENEQAIRETCDRLKIECIRFEPEWHLIDPLNDKIKEWLEDPTLQDAAFLDIPLEAVPNQGSVRHSHVIQYALDPYGYAHDDALAIMDGDAFFIRSVSLKQKSSKGNVCRIQY